MAGAWGVTPRASVRGEAARVGTEEVVDRCLAVLADQPVDVAFLRVLAGPAVDGVLAGHEGGLDGRWPRVWALRGLLHVWEQRAVHAVVAALGDESWRCREMAAKVVAAHRLDEALEALAPLHDDPVPRVRAAAERARMRLSQQ